MADPRSFQRRPTRPADTPRRVRGGVKLNSSSWPDRLSPRARRLLAAFRPAAPADAWDRALVYAAKGQARTFEITPESITASIQGVRPRAHDITLRFGTFSAEQWETVIDAITRSARYSAKLLAGEMPEDIEDLFAGLSLTFLPDTEAPQTTLDNVPNPAWDEHLACAVLLLIDRLERNPFDLFTLRGVRGEDLVERLRDRHAITTAAASPTLAPGRILNETPAAPLEDCLHRFWDAGPELDLIETTARPPETATPLLRRLGPSPFVEGKFPLVGLLATCYEVVSQHALDDQDRDADRRNGVDPADPAESGAGAPEVNQPARPH